MENRNILDLARAYPSYYKAPALQPQLVELTPAVYASLSGQGDPSGPGFAAHIQALYTVAYTQKMLCKAQGRDFKVAKLEGLWDFDRDEFPAVDPAAAPLLIPRSAWRYRLMIRLPDYVDVATLDIAVHMAAIRKQLPFIREVSLFRLHEARCVQILHQGPFEREPATLERLHAYLQQQGLTQCGLHHEIYLSDFRKTSPDRLRTILRAPVL